MGFDTIFCPTLREAFGPVGLEFPDKTMGANKYNRFQTGDKRGNTDGFCFLFADGKGAKFGCNHDQSFFVWQQRDTDAPPLSKQELQDARKRFEQQRKKAEDQLAKQYARRALDAVQIYNETAELEQANEYVLRKGIIPYLARQDAQDGSIVLPIRDEDGKAQSLQFIGAGGKRFLFEAKAKGGRLVLGVLKNGERTVVCEGWATACSLHEATGGAAVICFSGGNMATVAADLRHKCPDSPIFIAGDLDVDGSVSRRYATTAASACGGTVVYPLFADGRVKGDFNDLHQAEGLRVVFEQAGPVAVSDVVPFFLPSLPKLDARDGTMDSRPLTEFGNAQRLFDAHGERLRYVPELKKWIAWSGSGWLWDTGAGVRSLAARLPMTVYGEGLAHLNDAKFFAAWARKSQDQRTILASTALLSDFSNIRLPVQNIDADHFVVGFDRARQAIDLRTGKARPAQNLDYITKSLGVDRVGDASKAVRWRSFLSQVFCEDQELIDWLQKFCGYILSGSVIDHIFLFCYGSGQNGKSVFIDLLQFILGDYGRTIATETLADSTRQKGAVSPDLAALVGARLGVASETAEGMALGEEFIKACVAGNSVTARNLHCPAFEFFPILKLLMSGNHKPTIRGADDGIWRRVRLVPFDRKFTETEKDTGLLAKLKAEGPHVLAWMVEGCLLWQGTGLADTPKSIKDATQEYREDQDLTGRWIEQCTVLSLGGETSAAELYASYKLWSLDNGLKPASAVTLGRRLKDRGFKKRKTHGNQIWIGLNLSSVNSGDYASASGR